MGTQIGGSHHFCYARLDYNYVIFSHENLTEKNLILPIMACWHDRRSGPVLSGSECSEIEIIRIVSLDHSIRPWKIMLIIWANQILLWFGLVPWPAVPIHFRLPQTNGNHSYELETYKTTFRILKKFTEKKSFKIQNLLKFESLECKLCSLCYSNN